MASRKQQDRRKMEEKMAKVRELVPSHVSTSQIMTALQNFNMDADATIHAFLEGDVNAALGGWEQVACTKRQQGKNKPKQQQPAPLQTSAAKKNGIGSGGQSLSNTKESSASNSVVSINGYAPGVGVNGYNGGVGNGPNKAQPRNATPAQATKPAGGRNPPPQGSPAMGVPPSMASAPPAPSTLAALLKSSGGANVGTDAIIKAIQAEATNQLAQYAGEMETLEHNFQAVIDQTHTSLGGCFHKLQQGLAEREQKLKDELVKCRRDGDSIYATRRSALNTLQRSALALGAKSPRNEVDAWIKAWQNFSEGKANDRELIKEKLHLDLVPLLEAIRKLGQVTQVGTPKKRDADLVSPRELSENGFNSHGHVNSLSQSSVMSSYGGDVAEPLQQGNGLFAPAVAQQNGPAISSVSSSGITVQSDSFTADELADLQRQMEETLKAQGIDTSVSINMNHASSAAPPRRRQPRAGAEEKAGNHVPRSNGSARGEGSAKGSTSSTSKPPSQKAPMKAGGGRRD